MIWEPFVLALFLGLVVSAGLYFAYMWPSVEPAEPEPAVASADSRDKPEDVTPPVETPQPPVVAPQRSTSRKSHGRIDTDPSDMTPLPPPQPEPDMTPLPPAAPTVADDDVLAEKTEVDEEKPAT